MSFKWNRVERKWKNGKSIRGHKISFANEQFVLELMVGEGHNFQMCLVWCSVKCSIITFTLNLAKVLSFVLLTVSFSTNS